MVFVCLPNCSEVGLCIVHCLQYFLYIMICLNVTFKCQTHEGWNYTGSNFQGASTLVPASLLAHLRLFHLDYQTETVGFHAATALQAQILPSSCFTSVVYLFLFGTILAFFQIFFFSSLFFFFLITLQIFSTFFLFDFSASLFVTVIYIAFSFQPFVLLLWNALPQIHLLFSAQSFKSNSQPCKVSDEEQLSPMCSCPCPDTFIWILE